MNRIRKEWLVAGIALVLGAGMARAELGGGWSIAVTPYIWLTEMQGDVSCGRVSAPVDIGFDDSVDMLSDLRGALMLHGEASHGNFGGLADIYALHLRSENSSALGDSEVRITEYIGELAGAYAVVSGDRFRFEVLGGGRYQSLRTRIMFDDADRDKSRQKGFVDPFVGGRITMEATKSLIFALRGDAGGFGLGSDLTWNLLGSANWAFNEDWSASLGYRYLDVDYDKDGLKYHVRTDGPELGVTYTF